jgi:hypothetical protein
MLSTAINLNSIFCNQLRQLCSVVASLRSDSSQAGLGRNLYGYNPYNREPTPEEKLEAMAKNQEQKNQPSRDRGKSRVRQ